MFEETIRTHWERHCRGLTLEEAGAQLALAAAAVARQDGTRTLTLDGEALCILLGKDSYTEAVELLGRLRRRGKVRTSETSPGVYEVRLSMFSDQWAVEREKKRGKACVTCAG